MTSNERNDEFDIRDVDNMEASIRDMDTQELAHQVMDSNNYSSFKDFNNLNNLNDSSHPHYRGSPQDQVDLINANVQKLLRNRNKHHSLQNLGDSLKLKRHNDDTQGYTGWTIQDEQNRLQIDDNNNTVKNNSIIARVEFS